MFHVNHDPRRPAFGVPTVSGVSRESLADTELGEDGAKHLLDVDAAGEATEMVGRDPELLSLEFRG